MGNRQVRLAIQGLRYQIDLHQDKIDFERMKSEPNVELIYHWEQEVSAFTKRLERLESRLAVRRRRGRTG